ncbi:Protein smg7 [Mactra antiquata]
MSSVAQMLRQAEALKASVSDSSKTISETWVMRQKLEDVYKKILVTDLEYALDKKIEQELWNNAFKNQINNLQSQAKDKQNLKRGEVQATLNLFLETASGFYLQFLQLLCTTFKLDLPFRRKSAFYGVMKERTSLKLKVTPPKKSSCLYVCQHCLVHLGDIARYRQQIDQAQSYYWHAAFLVPFNGQPYNQLAILEAAKGNKLSTVFYYIRSLAVKVPFPVAATNLEKLYAKLTKETPEFKGKLSASEMITGFLQFHALVHLCTDLIKAEELSNKLAAGLPAHITSQSFPWQVLVQIVAINIFTINHVQQLPSHHNDDDDNYDGDMLYTNGDTELTDDEEKCFNLVFSLTVNMLDILLQYTPKQEHKVCDYFTLPAVKLLLDWLKLYPQNFDRPVLKNSPLWGNLCKVLNSLQTWQMKEWDDDVMKYEDLPLPEDGELRCFQPIEKAHSGYSYSKLPADGLSNDVEVRLRCHRLLEHGHWIKEQQPCVQLSTEIGKTGSIQFSSPTISSVTPVTTVTTTQSKVIKTVTLSVPNTRSNNTSPINTTGMNSERKSNRQNVAIQAIMQKQAQGKVVKIKEEPASPKYLLGVPTSEPVFFKTAGGSAGGSSVTGGSSNKQQQQQQQGGNNTQQSSTSPNKTTGQTGGVLVIKNQDILNQSTSRTNSNQSKSWQQQRQSSAGSLSWQQQQQQQTKSQPEKTGWPVLQQSQAQQGQGQPSSWQQQQQQQNTTRPQLSPQANQGHWQFPGKPNFPRPDFRARSPMTLQMDQANRNQALNSTGPVQSPQATFFSQGLNRPTFPLGQPGPQSQGQSSYNTEPGYKGLNPSGPGVMFNRPPMPGPGLQNASQGDRYSGSHMGSGEGPGLPFGPDFTAMFRHPPPSNRFPPPPNFQTPPPDRNLPTNQNLSSDVSMSRQTGNTFSTSNATSLGNHGNQTNFSHAPGTERLQQNDRQQQQIPPHLQMPFSQNQFMSPFQGFVGFPPMSNNNMKSPLDGLFGKPKFTQEDIPQNMAEIIGTLSKMAVQPPRDNVLPPSHVGAASFQGHAEGTPKPDSFYSSQRSSSVPAVNIDIESKSNETPPTSIQQQQPPGTYSLFSGSPWLSSGDSKSLGSSPFSSESSSIRNSPDPNSDVYLGDGSKTPQAGLDMALRFGNNEDRKHNEQTQQHGPFFQNNVQSIWQAQSPLERLLELQKQQRQTEPH